MAYSKVMVEGQISFFGEEHGTVRDAGDTKVVNFSVAIQQRKKEGDQWVNGETMWKRCEAWGRTAENIVNSFKKGDLVILTGEERADSFNKDGEKVVRDKVRVDSIGPALRWDTAESHREPSQGRGGNSGGNGGGAAAAASGGSSASSSNSGSKKSDDSFSLDDLDFDTSLDDSDAPF